MDTFWAVLFAAVALSWIVHGILSAHAYATLPRLEQAEPLPDAQCPRVSILVAARNEAQSFATALRSLLTQNYPDYEVVAVDDRSTDATGEILDQLAAEFPHLKAVHLRSLPPGWLGKPHALTAAYEESRGEWLVLTDADVHFAPDVLRRALSLARAGGRDHLTVFPWMEMKTFWEKTAMTYWVGAFVAGTRVWKVADNKSSAYMGGGAFQLVRRSTYEAVGTHRRLAMEVLEDMKLGKLVKQGGFASGVALGLHHLRIRWTNGLGGYIHNLTKNMFAACGFSVGKALAILLLPLTHAVLPVAGLLLLRGLPQWAAGACLLAGMANHLTNGVRFMRVSPLYALTFPLGGAIFIYVLLHSMGVTLRRGGVVWRETFHPLEELRRGMV